MPYGTLKRGERNHEHFCGGALRVKEGAVRGDLFDVHWVILRWSFRKSPSALSGPAIIEGTRRKQQRLGQQAPLLEGPRVFGEIFAFDDAESRLPDLDRLEALIPPMPPATTGESCCPSRQTRAWAFLAWAYAVDRIFGNAPAGGRWPP